MRSGDLKVWRKEENRDKEPEGRRWELAVRLMQVIFRDGTMPLKIEWVKMVLVPKWKGGYRGVGLVDILWKLCSVVVNCWMKMSAVLNDALHGFIEGRGTGTATLERNLDQQLAGLLHEPLFQVFLYFWKAYDSLDW